MGTSAIAEKLLYSSPISTMSDTPGGHPDDETPNSEPAEGYSPPSQPPPPKAASDNSQGNETISELAKTALNGSLWGSGLLFGVPLLIGIWLTAGGVATVYGAWLLLETEGLSPTTYGGAFWLALAMSLLGIGGGIFLRFRWRKGQGRKWRKFFVRPSISLFLGLALPAGALSVIEMSGTNLPDTVTTAFILGAIGYVWFLLPFACARGLWWAIWGVRRRAGRSQFAAGLTAGLAPLSGLATTAMALLMGVFAWSATAHPFLDYDSQHSTSLVSVIAQELDRSGNPVDGSLYALSTLGSATDKALEDVDTDDQNEEAGNSSDGEVAEAASAASAPSPPALAATAQRQRRNPVTDCVEELQAPEEFSGPPYEAAKRRVSRSLNWIDSGGAEDIAWDVLVDVCQRHAEKNYRHLPKVYNRSVSNAIVDEQRRRQLWREVEDAVANNRYDPARKDTLFRLRILRCLEDLPSKHSEVVHAELGSENGRELAAKLGTSYGNARKRLQRARDYMEAKCDIDRP